MSELEMTMNEVENDETQKYIDAINEMKKTSVSKQDYEKLRDENKKLLDTLVQGKTIETTSTEVAKPSVKELRNKLFNTEQSNLDYWQNVIDLRDAVMEKGGKDPFLPYGQKIAPTAEDVEKANKVADVISDCIKYADGDSAIFTNELQRRTVDVIGVRRK